MVKIRNVKTDGKSSIYSSNENEIFELPSSFTCTLNEILFALPKIKVEKKKTRIRSTRKFVIKMKFKEIETFFFFFFWWMEKSKQNRDYVYTKRKTQIHIHTKYIYKHIQTHKSYT